MDRDFVSAQHARDAPSLAELRASPDQDAAALYRPVHSPPCELSSRSPLRRRTSNGTPVARPQRRWSPPPSSAVAGAAQPIDADGRVYTQLQTELFPHINF